MNVSVVETAVIATCVFDKLLIYFYPPNWAVKVELAKLFLFLLPPSSESRKASMCGGNRYKNVLSLEINAVLCL